MKMNKRLLIELVSTILILILFIVLIILNYIDIKRKSATESLIDDASKISSSATFEISKISCYSSAVPTNIDNSSGSWKFDLYQYTDISLYISNLSSNQHIKSFYLDDFKYKNLETGTPNICYKNINNFGKFENTDVQNTRIEFEVLPTNSELDTSKPQIYNDLSNPITLEYTNQIFTEKTLNNLHTLSYDGSILKSSSVLLTSISCMLSFKVHIITEDDLEHISTVTFEIPLSSESNSIYSGSFMSDIKYSVRF